jgi:ATP-dependent helicase/nuclease subunit B
MRRNIFTISPGAPFLATFVDALLDGAIVASLSRGSAPLDFARATIYVPTQRASRALAAQFARAIGRPAAILPRILPLGGLDEHETAALFDDEFAFDEAAPPPIEEIDRRLILARLVSRWTESLRHAIVSIDPTGRPVLDEREATLVAPTPANAYRLAVEMAALIDEFAIEGVDPAAIDRLVDDEFDDYWRITTQFLRIAFHEWPAILADRNRIDAAERRRRLMEARIARVARDGAAAPVVALGSTGAQPMTARLLGAIARAPQGAVVLPGLDLALDDAAWARIAYGPDDGDEPAFTHPQAMLKRLLALMETTRGEVRELGAPPAPLRARAELVSEAMRPAAATEAWRAFRSVRGGEFAPALAGVAYVEAPDERLEALTLALFMREALESPARTAALITPDRAIARRVALELERFDIAVDDSAGRPLAATSVGALARLAARAAQDGLTAVNVAALLSHPFTRLGFARARLSEIAGAIEIAVLRAVGRVDAGWPASLAAARALAEAPHALPAVCRLTDDDWRAMEEALTRLEAAVASMRSSGGRALSDWASAHRDCLDALMRAEAEESAVDAEGVEELLSLFSKLISGGGAFDVDAANYAALFDSLAFETTVRGPRRAHPRLKILGPLEARLLDADLALLAGLDETVWPPSVDSGAFLNRSMRRQLGLSPPERRIGLSAHDFATSLGAANVVVSRAAKRDGSPTVASRFVARLRALADDAFTDCKARGDAMLAIAAALDRPDEIRSCARPEPRPPVALRPTRLSVTRIETLRRDPYAIYAERTLELAALPPLGAEPGAREIGTAIHASLADFAQAFPAGPLPPHARERLLGFASERLAGLLSDPAFRTFEWPRLAAALDHALAFDAARRDGGGDIFCEETGRWEFPLLDGSTFLLTAQADRIETNASGEAEVFDYKTGTPPSNRQVCAGFAPQLTLEAAMIEAGAFAKVGARAVGGAAYVPLAQGDGEPKWVKCADGAFSDLVAEHRRQLVELLSQFRVEQTPYPSRPFVAFAARRGDYDHLARVNEWSRGGGGEGE